VSQSVWSDKSVRFLRARRAQRQQNQGHEGQQHNEEQYEFAVVPIQIRDLFN